MVNETSRMSIENPTPKSIERIQKLVQIYTSKSGTVTHPDATVTESVILGLARNLDRFARPLCPCRFYPNAEEEIKHRTWICACDDMQIYKYCHCLLFVTPDGDPITEYLPEDHEGRQHTVWWPIQRPNSEGRCAPTQFDGSRNGNSGIRKPAAASAHPV